MHAGKEVGEESQEIDPTNSSHLIGHCAVLSFVNVSRMR